MSTLSTAASVTQPAPQSEPAEVVLGVLILVPEPLSGRVRALRTSLSEDVVAVPTHVTLIPPTTVAATELPSVVEHLGAVAAGERPFSIRLLGTDTFQPVTDVVFLPLADGRDSCDRLQERLRGGPLQVDLRFPYHPHVTLAHDIPQAGLDQARAAMESVDETFTVDRFVLYADPSGTEDWEPVREFPLATS